MKTKHERPAREKRPMKERVRRMFGRRFRAGGYAVFAAAVVIAIAVMANLMAGALPSEKTKIDDTIILK